jgi:hypothetical protein
MKPFRTFTTLLGLALLFMAFSPIANADEWDRTTKITFNEAVQVPGKVLPAGTYVLSSWTAHRIGTSFKSSTKITRN